MTETKLPEYLKKKSFCNKGCGLGRGATFKWIEICDIDQQKHTEKDLIMFASDAWELTQERIKKAILEMKKKNHEVQMRNKESGKYQEGFAYGMANAKAFIKEVFK